MTEEKLNKGGELIKRIKRLIEQKEKWEEANAIHKIELSTTITYCRQSKYMDVDYSCKLRRYETFSFGQNTKAH